MESEFWDVIKQIAIKEKVSINDLVGRIDLKRKGNLSSALRLYVLEYIMQS